MDAQTISEIDAKQCHEAITHRALARGEIVTTTWTLETTLDLIRTIVQIVVVAAGAVWSYYSFVRSRTFKLRLEPTVSGIVRNEKDSTYVKISSKLKNIGQCKVDVSQTGSAVKILSHIPKATDGTDVITWERLKTLPVFEKHAILEPGETVNDEVLVAVPAAVGGQVFRLELRLVSKGIEWNAVSIVDPAQSETEKGN